ncbi:MAG: glycosyltransferase family 10 [Bacteroidota bacterium]
MAKPVIKIRFQNGLTFQSFKKDVFDIEGLSNLFDFEESVNPDFIVFGPYGNDIPPKGDYTRIGYYCENIRPDMESCDWAFGVPHESEVNHPRYKRILWHGIDPSQLLKNADYDAENIYNAKKHFCNFLYTHKVLYREFFFKLLSKYKKVDAPGPSMNNMAGIDDLYQGDIWERKRQFLSPYKFTIAFENYMYPGYQTEKLYDAMMANSIPIYMGDPFVSDIFNTKSFINANDYIIIKNKPLLKWLEKLSQPNFTDIRPAFYKSPLHRLSRLLKAWGRDIKMHIQFKNVDFDPLINHITELDNNRELYIEMLKQPWFINNELPAIVSLKNRWIKIFETKNG